MGDKIMGKPLTVTNLRIASRQGDNGLPWSGGAAFSDGRYYEWGRDFDTGEIDCVSSRRPKGGLAEGLQGDSHTFTFRSPRRAKAIEAAINAC